MEFGQSQQSFSQTQQSQTPSAPTISLQQISALLPFQRASFYQQYLVQQPPIHIPPNGTLSNLSHTLKASLDLLSLSSDIRSEASHIFYINNTFLLSITSILDLLSWTHISSHITRLAILFHPPPDTGGGSQDLLPLLSPHLNFPRLPLQKPWSRDLVTTLSIFYSLPTNTRENRFEVATQENWISRRGSGGGCDEIS